MRLSNFKIGNTEVGSWKETMAAPENWWCSTVWKFNLVTFPTIILLWMSQ